MNLPQGVKVELYNELNPEPFAPNVKGYLGTFNDLNLWPDDPDPGQKYANILIEVVVEPGRTVYGFYVDAEKDTYECQNFVVEPFDDNDPALDYPEGSKVFRQHATVKDNKKTKKPTTMFPDNSIRLLESLGNGWYKLWRVAVVTQGDKFFLVTEEGEPFRCYKSGLTVVCPALIMDEELERKGWPRLVTLLNTFIHGEDFRALPDVSEVANDPQPDKRVQVKPNGIKDNQAKVVWFSDAEQYGMVVCRKDGKVVVARAHIDNMTEYRPGEEEGRVYLKAGEIIEFGNIGSPTQTTDRETSFKYEVYYFRLVQSS